MFWKSEKFWAIYLLKLQNIFPVYWDWYIIFCFIELTTFNCVVKRSHSDLDFVINFWKNIFLSTGNDNDFRFRRQSGLDRSGAAWRAPAWEDRHSGSRHQRHSLLPGQERGGQHHNCELLSCCTFNWLSN